MRFGAPQINLYARDLMRSVEFYQRLGFRETFRYAPDGVPKHVELVLDGFTIGIASAEAAAADHNLPINLAGHGIEVVLWTDDTSTSFDALVAVGCTPLSKPHDWLADLRLAWVADPDGNPIQLVQKRTV